VREGRWPQTGFGQRRKVSGSRFGIVGLGRVGRDVAHRLADFGETISFDIRRQETAYQSFDRIESLAQWANVLITCAAASASTSRLIGPTVLEALGSHGFLINVARGSMVDEPALMEALRKGAIAVQGSTSSLMSRTFPPNCSACRTLC